jgi:ankyrin repeat protein
MPTLADKQGNTVLHMDITPEQAKRCLDAGDDINFKNNRGETPLYRACHNNNFDLVKFLIENGADKTNVSWSTAEEIQRYLVQAGCPASGDFIKKYGTIEQKANIKISFDEARESLENTKIYISQNGDIDHQDSDGWSLLHYAIKSDNLEWVKFLVEKGANQKIKDKSGRVPARFPSNKFEIYNLLKDNINEPDNKGNTCIHVAAMNYKYDRIKHLVSIGAKFNIQNEDGKTAYDLCSDKSLFKTFEEDLNDLVSDDKVFESLIILNKRLPKNKKPEFLKIFIDGI